MTNEILKSFVSTLETKFSDESKTMSMSEWVQKYTHLRRKPFSFEGYEFQKAILDDMSQDLSVIKPSQVGLSEIQVRKFLGMLKRNTAISVIFTLPNEAMFKRLSQTRIKPLVENEDIFNQHSNNPIRNTGLYQIDDSFGYVTGMTEGSATSIPADAILHDEIDLSDQSTVGLYQSRLQGSSMRITQRFGTPTLVGYGIDLAVQNSDQFHYLCRCTKCRHWNDPDFEPRYMEIPGLPDSFDSLADFDRDIVEKLDLQNSYIRCERCGEPLDVLNPDLREWVPKYPGRRARGYIVRPFCTPNITIEYIFDQLVKRKQLGDIKGWHNTVLGRPYSDSNARLQEHEIRSIMRGNLLTSIDKNTPYYVGIDVGLSCHLTFATPTREGLAVFCWMVVPAGLLIETIKDFMKEFPNLIGGAMDRHPYTPLANDVRDATGGRILPLEYRGHSNLHFHKDEFDNIAHVQGNRTFMIDDLVSKIRKKAIWFFDYRQYETMIVDHLQDMVRIETPDKPATWEKVTGQDHFFHSLAFLTASTKISELHMLQTIGTTNVMTSFMGVSSAHQSASLGMHRTKK